MQDPNFSFDNPESIGKLSRAAPSLAPVVIKNYQDATAARVKAVEDARVAKLNETVANVQRLSMFNTPDEVVADISKSTMDENLKQSLLASVPKDPTQFEPWRLGLLRKATEWLKPESGLAFTDTQVNSGDQTRMIRTMTNDPFGAPREVASFKEQPTPDQLLDNQRAAAAERGPQVVTSTNAAGDFIIMDKNILNDPLMNPTGASSIVIPGAGKPSGGFEKAQAARGEYMKNYTAAKAVADELLKSDSDLERARGGGITTVGNAVMGFFDQSTPSAEAQGALDVAADTLLKQIQRFEGPQSDKDVVSYEKAAASLRNTMTPMPVKKAALKVLRDALVRQKAYYDANPQAGASATGAGGGAGGVINWEDM
jgi:hypothetical protein